MEPSKFAAILPVTIGGLLNKIIDEAHISDDEAFDSLYNSKLYAELENEETKLWTYSSAKLFELYQNEIDSGQLVLPEF